MSSQLPGDVELAFDDDELLRAVRALPSGDLEPALDFLAATRDQPCRRELALDTFGAAGIPAFQEIVAAAAARPDDVNTLMLLGAVQCFAGWQARGGKRAKYTTDDQFNRLINFTQQARETMHRAAELDPDDVGPWVTLMSVALGAPTHRGEPAEVYAEVEKRVPDLVNVTLRRLQTLAAKWYGSHEEMFEFARTRIVGLPDGHPLLSLIAIAHIEMHLANMRDGSKLKRMWKILTYLRKHRDEVNAASDRLLAGTDDHPHSRWGHQIFAVYYHEADVEKDVPRLAQHLARSGDHVMQWPWAYFGNHKKGFAAARAKTEKSGDA